MEVPFKKDNVVVFSKATCLRKELRRCRKVYEIEQRQDGAEIQVRIWKVNEKDDEKLIMVYR